MHLFHNVQIFVPKSGALWDMGQGHLGIREIGLCVAGTIVDQYFILLF